MEQVLDQTKASIARVYDYSLDGKDNYAVDRAAYRELLKIAPHQGEVSKANRRWLERVVRYLASEVGIDQFLDLGSGLPTARNTHQVAQETNPESRVVYVDKDPVCLAHGRALLAENEHTSFVGLDFTEPDAVMSHTEVREHLDLDRPLALMQCGTLHHLPDEGDPAGLMQRYIDALPAGSYVMISHFWDPDTEDEQLHQLARGAEEALVNAGLGSGWWRPRAAIAAMFDGLEIVQPGLVRMHEWWPIGPPARTPWPEEHLLLCGVGIKR